MQRTFSSFPSGWAGAALLVLRLVVGASATLEAGLTIAHNHTPAHMATIAAGTAAIAGVALIIGFLTPITSLFFALLARCSWVTFFQQRYCFSIRPWPRSNSW